MRYAYLKLLPLDHQNSKGAEKAYSELLQDELKILRYYRRLSEENKDLIKGTMAQLILER